MKIVLFFLLAFGTGQILCCLSKNDDKKTPNFNLEELKRLGTVTTYDGKTYVKFDKDYDYEDMRIKGPKMSSEAASGLCKQHGGIQVEPKDSATCFHLRDAFQSSSFYIGINDKASEGNWVYDSTGEPVTFTKWASAEWEPDSSGNCAVQGANGFRYDKGCNESEYHPVCQF